MSRRSSSPLAELLDASVALLVSTVLVSICIRALAPLWPVLLALVLLGVPVALVVRLFLDGRRRW